MNKNQDVIEDNSTKKFNKLSLVSFIFCIIGIFIAGLPCGVIALITGIIGVVKFNAETEKGRWMAITGLIIGILEIILMGLYMILLAVGIGA